MWVVDTCVLIDIADADPDFGRMSADCLHRLFSRGLTISPVTYVELAPVFAGSTQRITEFLKGVGVNTDATFNIVDRAAAFRAWSRHISAKRAGQTQKRPVADALIGALAARCDGLITRNPRHFSSFYPGMSIIDPANHSSEDGIRPSK